MSDIFISYASEDRERIMSFVRALEKTGWSVFWDRTIPTGKTWRQVIGSEISNCRSIVVVWSKTSIESDWVQEEAEIGKGRHILFPVLIDNVMPPFGFGNIQAETLVDWDGKETAPEFKKLINDLTNVLGIPPEVAKEEKHQIAEEEARLKAEEDQRYKTAEEATARENKTELERKAREAEEERRRKQEEERRRQEEEQIEKIQDESTVDTKLIALIAVSMFFGMFNRFSFEIVSLDLFFLQIFSCFFIGYNYRPMVAFIAGALIFLPNLTIGILSRNDVPTVIPLFSFPSKTLGVDYLFYGLFPFAVALEKSLIRKQMGKALFLSFSKMEYKGKLTFGYTAAIILLSITLNIGFLRFNFNYALLSLFSLWVYRYGLEQSRHLFIALIIIHIITFKLDNITIFDSPGYATLALFALLLIFYSHLKVDNQKTSSLWLFSLSLTIICLLTSFTFHAARYFTFHGGAFALPCMFFLGNKFRCRQGFLGGLILGCVMVIRLYLTDTFIWGGYDMLYFIAAPLIGYLGGTDFVKKDFLGSGMKILGVYYAALLFTIITNYGFTIVKNLDDLVNMGASIMLLLIFSVFAKKPQHELV